MVEGTSEPGVLRPEYDGVAVFIPQLYPPDKVDPAPRPPAPFAPGTLRKRKEKLMIRELKLFVHADYFGEPCREKFRAEKLDPDHGYICAIITFPDESKEPPDNLLQAARFAQEANEGEARWVDLARSEENGRIPIVDSFVTFGEKKVRFLVGFSERLK